MFDVGFSELVLLAIVALVVLGPEKLPHAARVAGAWVGRIRRTISTMQAEIEREVGAQEIKARMEKEFGATGATGFVQQLGADLEQERKSIEGELRQTENSIADAISPSRSSVAADETSSTVTSAAVDAPPAPLLSEVATPLHEVNMDGEAAYRQWLESQKRSKADSTGTNSTTGDSPAS